MTPVRHRALVFNTRLFAGTAADDALVTGSTFRFCRLMCLCVKWRNINLNGKHRSLSDSALFRADNRTEQKTISPFSLALIFTFDFAALSERRSCPEDRSRRFVPVGTLRRHKLHMNAVLEAVRQMALMKNGGEENDLHLRTLQVAQIREDEYFGSLIADDLKGILRDIREQHRPDTITADETTLVATVQGQLQDAMNFEGSSEEKQVRSFLATFGIDYDKLTKEQFVSLIEILKLSKYLKSPINQRGKARPQLQHGKGKKNRK